MRVWKFFKLPSTPKEETPPSVKLMDRYTLYAITNDKELAESFMDIHDMKKFIVKNMKDVDSEEYSMFANKNRGEVLSWRELMTHIDGEVKRVSLPLTALEENCLDEPFIPSITDEFFWINIPFSPSLFKEKYYDSLELIDFNITYDLINQTGDRDDYSGPDYWYDQLEIYISQFQEILK